MATRTNDVVNFTSEFVRLGQNSRLLSEQVTPDVLTSFSKVFVEMLGSVYENLQIGAGGLLDGLAFQAFYLGDRSEVDWPSDLER